MVTPRSCSQRTFVSPRKNQRSSYRMDFRWSFFVVRRGKLDSRLKRSCLPNTDSVPVPVRSALCAPRSSTSATRSRYCCSPRLSGIGYSDLGDDFRRALEAVGGFLGQQAVEERLVHGKQIRK